MQNISPIKERILQFIDTHCSSKREFYAITHISRGTLESKTGISEETFTKIFASYQNLSPIWVLTGKGEMLIDHSSTEKIEILTASTSCPFCKEKDERIGELKDHIDTLRERVQEQKAQIILLEKVPESKNSNYSQTA